MKSESEIIIENNLLALIHAKFESTLKHDKFGNAVYENKSKSIEQINDYIKEYAKDLQENEQEVKEYVKKILKKESQVKEYQKQNNELLELMEENEEASQNKKREVEPKEKM